MTQLTAIVHHWLNKLQYTQHLLNKKKRKTEEVRK